VQFEDAEDALGGGDMQAGLARDLAQPQRFPALLQDSEHVKGTFERAHGAGAAFASFRHDGSSGYG
jgi:hypothetical protein